MHALLLAIFLAVSGDPLVDFTSAQYSLTAAQITSMTGWLVSNWPTLNINNLTMVNCTPSDTCAMLCGPVTNEPSAPGSTIRALLLSMVAWTPSSSNGRILIWPPVCLSGSALSGFNTFVQAVVTEVGAQTIRTMQTVQSSPGSYQMSAHYARSMSAADCATYSNLLLQPLGITP